MSKIQEENSILTEDHLVELQDIMQEIEFQLLIQMNNFLQGIEFSH
jgi:hypothetical protein